jgi:UTP-glucose-1-phosphate uridylyltransferase
LLNGGSLYLCSCILIQRTKQRQVERQGFVKRVEVADEPVVVIKSVPEKP